MADPNLTTKYCPDCKTNLPVSDFAKNASRRDGLQGICKKSMKIRYEIKRTSILAQHRVHYAANFDRISAYGKRYYKDHKAECQERMKIYREENSEHLKKAKREYHQRADIKERRRLRYERNKVIAARFTAKQYGAQGDCTEEQWRAKLEYWGRRCYLCLSHLDPEKTEIEHRIPFSRGGSNWPANLAPACRPCNKSKGRRTETEYRATLSF